MDWKNIKNYPAENSTGERWAWEFLRRSPEYRKDYKRVVRHWDEELSHPKVLEVFQRYQIGALGHPDDGSTTVFVAPPYDLTLSMTFHGGKYFDPRIEDYEAAFKFDVRSSVEEQLAIVKKELLRRRKELRLPSSRKRDLGETYQRFLRILDATVAGETNAVIAKVLYSRNGKKILSVDRRRAEALRDGGYLSLVRP